MSVSKAKACLGVAVLVCNTAWSQGIYSCTDAKGRKLTSDRPIVDCNDREQREITPSGTVKRVIPAPLSAQERAVYEEKERVALEERIAAGEGKRRDRALLMRYPNRVAHDAERAAALTKVDERTELSAIKLRELAEQRKSINTDLEFYKKDPNKAPLPLKRRIEENDSNIAMQGRFLVDQDAEKRNVNQRFDDELGKLNGMWSQMGKPMGAESKASQAPGTKK